jgi:hypothetical protein
MEGGRLHALEGKQVRPRELLPIDKFIHYCLEPDIICNKQTKVLIQKHYHCSNLDLTAHLLEVP